jgi:hypothetical protein
MMLVVIVGISVLALDGARYMSLQTELQNRADALALAGAAELDRLRLTSGDILIVEGKGSPDQIGRNALFTIEGEEWIHQNHIIRCRPGPRLVPQPQGQRPGRGRPQGQPRPVAGPLRPDPSDPPLLSCGDDLCRFTAICAN